MPILNLTQKCLGCHTWSHLPQDREEEGIFSLRLNIKSNLKIFHLLFERQPGNKEKSSTISLFHWEWKILDESLSLFSLYLIISIILIIPAIFPIINFFNMIRHLDHWFSVFSKVFCQRKTEQDTEGRHFSVCSLS